MLLLIACVSTNAFAQDDKERAQKLYKEGAEAFYTDDYPLAIMKFKSGHSLDPNPMFLYNIAVSYGRLGNVDEAYRYAEQADEGGLPKEADHKNKARLRSWGTELAATSLAESIGGPTDAVAACTTDSECVGGETCDTDRNVCVASADVAASTTTDSGGGLGALGWTGVVLGTAGVGLVVTALVMDASLSSDFDELDAARAAGDRERAETLESDIESSQSTGKILLFAGAGAAVVGGTLLVIDLLDSEKGESASIVPLLGPNQAGAAFISSF